MYNSNTHEPAPEMHLAGRYGLPVDVFSFGMIAWELFSQHHHDNPVKGLPAYAAAEKVAGMSLWKMYYSLPLTIS
jgi:hypothetical protein